MSNPFIYKGVIKESVYNIIFRSRHVNNRINVNKGMTEEDILGEMVTHTPSIGKMIKEFNLEL